MHKHKVLYYLSEASSTTKLPDCANFVYSSAVFTVLIFVSCFYYSYRIEVFSFAEYNMKNAGWETEIILRNVYHSKLHIAENLQWWRLLEKALAFMFSPHGPVGHHLSKTFADTKLVIDSVIWEISTIDEYFSNCLHTKGKSDGSRALLA